MQKSFWTRRLCLFAASLVVVVTSAPSLLSADEATKVCSALLGECCKEVGSICNDGTSTEKMDKYYTSKTCPGDE